MINFIKDAVESVEGIKSFLFNTDYRNNFDLQNVEFPCCVLTPIMRTNYDLNNIIRESAELQLSVVDLAPYEYTGDDLYEINKRCSDLALQVIANLQVKSKLEKELTFEFILPSGDELISGVMCNLQCTMKQGSCIGKPSYVEVIVQPIKREIITSNGKHVISPSSGFTAMKEVEVDINIDIPTIEEKSVDITRNGEVEILPTSADAMTKVTANVQVPPPPLEEKQVTITNAKTTEIITPDAEYGLNRVEVSTDIPLESKQITITENGTTTIEASEGFEGIESVEITTDVDTLQGLDFSRIYDAKQAEELNDFYKAGIKDGEAILRLWNEKKTSIAWKWEKAKNTFFPNVNMQNITNATSTFTQSELKYFYCDKFRELPIRCDNMFYYCASLTHAYLVGARISSCTGMFNYCGSLKSAIVDIKEVNDLSNLFSRCLNIEKINDNNEIDIANAVNLNSAFYQCGKLKELTLRNANNVTNFSSAFSLCYSLEECYIEHWKYGNISFSNSTLLSPESIHYIIQNAVDFADGATARTLTLNATAKTNWQNSEYYEQDLAVLSTKGITIA